MKNKIKSFFNLLFAVFCFVLVLVIIIYGNWNSKKSNYQIIADIDEFYSIYNSSGPQDVFIDLRDEKDYSEGHLSKFMNVPYTGNEKDKKILCDFLSKNYSKNNTLILMCYSSKRASNAFMFLKEKGYSNLILTNLKSDDLINVATDISKGLCNCID